MKRSTKEQTFSRNILLIPHFATTRQETVSISSKALLGEAGGAAGAGATPLALLPAWEPPLPPSLCDYRRVKTLVPTLRGGGGNVREGGDVTVSKHTPTSAFPQHICTLAGAQGLVFFLCFTHAPSNQVNLASKLC